MNTAPILPAVIDRDADGTPRSREHDDIYHPRGGALAQARHVFLDGDGLAARWRGHDRYVVLETGFGLGSNFLATWAAWRADPGRCRRLHFISIESTPPTRSALAATTRDPSLRPLADALEERWPPHTWNLHRLAFDDGAVELLLAFGDVAAWLPQLLASVDAFFLDGFAPARNPAMWDARLFKAMARLAAPQASVSTWTAARAVRDGLRSAGFDVALAQGSQGKRDITRAVFAPRFQPRQSRRTSTSTASRRDSGGEDRVLVVGAGLAGCAVAAALAESGRSCIVLDRRADVASEASGNAAGLFHGVVHAADGRHARFHRAAAFAARESVGRARALHDVSGSVDGLLRLEPGAALDGSSLQSIVDRLGLPSDYVRALSSAEASELAGVSLAAPAWHYPQGGWVDPRALARSWLVDAGSRVDLRLGSEIDTMRRIGDRWALFDADGRTIATASTVVLCNGSGALDRHTPLSWPVRRQRGQVSSIATTDAAPDAVPRLPVTGSGYVLPEIGGCVWFGASAQWDDDDDAVRESDHRENLDRWGRLVAVAKAATPHRLSGRTSWRWVSGDRLPLIGAVPAAAFKASDVGRQGTPSSRLDHARFVARAPGLFVFAALGSRGIASASLGGRLLAAAITGAPSVVETDLVDAVDPARFISRQFRHDEAARNREASSEGQPPVAGSPGAAA